MIGYKNIMATIRCTVGGMLLNSFKRECYNIGCDVKVLYSEGLIFKTYQVEVSGSDIAINAVKRGITKFNS